MTVIPTTATVPTKPYNHCAIIQEDVRRKGLAYANYIRLFRKKGLLTVFPDEELFRNYPSTVSMIFDIEGFNPTACIVLDQPKEQDFQYSVPNVFELANLASEMIEGIREANENELKSLNDFFDEGLSEHFWHEINED
jgi:hypothetical protein